MSDKQGKMKRKVKPEPYIIRFCRWVVDAHDDYPYQSQKMKIDRPKYRYDVNLLIDTVDDKMREDVDFADILRAIYEVRED